ncbi:DNA replication and repair protein RecF [Estrella lausannensis]|uniref:DNA replication and repair protein RecF n=2 Tax=Estrella lausannensis TaxID=483423 RepID=A0A0H5DPE6_9BACT|nr:DNA replication and repair protein RecF [Estrella lausannensis]
MYLKNFRRFKGAALEFSPECTLISGPNAAGKTTLLEAVHLLIFGRSFRAMHMKEMIMDGEEDAAVELDLVKEGVEHTLGLYFGQERKKIRFNATEYRSLTSLIGLLTGASLLPTDVHLITGQPQLRRSLIDSIIAQVDPLYIHHLSRYAQTVKSRNCLLKAREFKAIDLFEEEMAKSAVYITKARVDAVQAMDQIAAREFALFSQESEHVRLSYLSSFGKEEVSCASFMHLMRANRMKESYLGFTLAGPHKDDLLIHLSGKECRLYASEGQKRSVAAAIKLAAWSHLACVSSTLPLLLVDDAALGFDALRRERFFYALKSRGQVLITSADKLEGSWSQLDLTR